MSIDIDILTATLDRKETAAQLWQQFCANTGRNLYDSGGSPEYDAAGTYVGSSAGYGRSYEKQRSRNPPGVGDLDVRIDSGKLFLSVHPYVTLSQNLLACPGLDEAYSEFCDAIDFDGPAGARVPSLGFAPLPALLIDSLRHESEFKVLKGFLKFLYDIGVVHDIDDPMNTYTAFSDRVTLKQDIQYQCFTARKDRKATSYSAVMTHNGCDIRSGYSAPRFYRGWIEEAISGLSNMGLVCENCDAEAEDEVFLKLSDVVKADPDIGDCIGALKKSAEQLYEYKRLMRDRPDIAEKAEAYGAGAIHNELDARLKAYAVANNRGIADTNTYVTDKIYCGACGGNMRLM